jgi:hypothetical protein
MRSPIIKDATTTVLLSPATKQALGLWAQIEAIRASAADSDVNDPDIFKARAYISPTGFQKLTHILLQASYFQKLMGTLIPGIKTFWAAVSNCGAALTFLQASTRGPVLWFLHSSRTSRAFRVTSVVAI